MKFARFNKFGPLSNWGSYSTEENELLDLEMDIMTIITNKPQLASVERINGMVQDFIRVMNNPGVQQSEYGSIRTRLTDLLKRLESLDKDPHPTFQNHQPDALVGEIRTHLANRKAARNGQASASTAKIVHFNPTTASAFHAMLATGQKFLWTLDVDGYLSIGDPIGNKHSVVAVGKDVKGAGNVQLKMDPRHDAYLAKKDMESRADDLARRAGDLPEGDKERKLFMENAAVLREMAATEGEALGHWTPPVGGGGGTVELDFDSGHYSPHGGWIDSTKAWNKAGYQVEWSANSRFN